MEGLNNPGMNYVFAHNRIGKMMDFQAKLIDMKNEAIVQECIKAANEAGITDLLLLDKKFIVDAIREKMEREGLMDENA